VRRSRSRSCEDEFLPFYYKFLCSVAVVGAYDNEVGAVAPGRYIEHCGIGVCCQFCDADAAHGVGGYFFDGERRENGDEVRSRIGQQERVVVEGGGYVEVGVARDEEGERVAPGADVFAAADASDAGHVGLSGVETGDVVVVVVDCHGLSTVELFVFANPLQFPEIGVGVVPSE